MNETHVYELDTDELITALREALEDHGYDITEQSPAGVWWLRAGREPADASRDITEAVDALLAQRLREIQQDS